MLTLSALANELNRHPQTIRRWAESNLIPSERKKTLKGAKNKDRLFLFDLAEVEKAMEKNGLKKGASN